MLNPNTLAFKRGPRARACDTCRRWKKRCDQLKPACTRCSDSGSECTYSYVKVYYQCEAQTANMRQEASRRHGYLISLPVPRRNSTNHIPDYAMEYHYETEEEDKTRTSDEPHPMYQQRNPHSLPSLSSLLLPTAPRRNHVVPENLKFEPYTEYYGNTQRRSSSTPSSATLNFPSSVLLPGIENAQGHQYSQLILPPLPTCGPPSPLTGHFI